MVVKALVDRARYYGLEVMSPIVGLLRAGQIRR